MKMPVHMFISMCNILAGQFKEEAEKQEKEQQDLTADLPNLSSFANIGNITSNLGLPNLSSLNLSSIGK